MELFKTSLRCEQTCRYGGEWPKDSPLNLDRILASSLLIRLISASLLLPGIKEKESNQRNECFLITSKDK